MSEAATRYEKIADGFGARVAAVPADAWDRPAPCDGWRARDVVGHLAEWVPAFFAGVWDQDPPSLASAEDDPAATWAGLDAWLRAGFDDDELAASERDTPMGRMRWEAAVDMIVSSDVLIHTWDLARATGLDERLDPDEVHTWVTSMEPSDAALRASGHYGPRVAVPDDAPEQDRLLAFLGRQP